MSTRKAPAYQWYPKDYAEDETVKLMTYEQEGIYRRLLDHQALHGSIPVEVRQVAMLVPKVPLKRFLMAWEGMKEKFPVVEGRRVNLKLKAVKQQTADYKAKQAANGRRGAAERWGEKVAG